MLKKLAILLLSSVSCFAIPATNGVFTIVDIPDIHARLGGLSGGQGTDVTNWIALEAWVRAHTNDSTNNVALILMDGDICEQGAAGGGIDNDTNKISMTLLTNFVNNMRLAGIATIPRDGNHDADNLNQCLDNSGYLDNTITQYLWTNIWPLTTLQLMSNIAGVGFITNLDGGLLSQRCVFTYTNGPVKLFFGSLSCRFPLILNGVYYDIQSNTTPQIAALQQVVARFPDHQVIAGFHFMGSWSLTYPFMHLSNDYSEADGPSSFYPYLMHSRAAFYGDTSLLQITNLLMVTSGHNRALVSGRMTLRSWIDGHTIDCQAFNMQGFGVNGAYNSRIVKLIKFNAPQGRVEVKLWDIAADRAITSITNNSSYVQGTMWTFPFLGYKHAVKRIGY